MTGNEDAMNSNNSVIHQKQLAKKTNLKHTYTHTPPNVSTATTASVVS